MSSARTNAMSTRNGSSRKNDPTDDSLRCVPGPGGGSSTVLVVVVSSLITRTLDADQPRACRGRPSSSGSGLRELAGHVGGRGLVALEHRVHRRGDVLLGRSAL